MASPDKDLEKLWASLLKEMFKSHGWKHTSGIHYTYVNNHLYTFIMVKYRKKPLISAKLSVKFIPLDDLFWTILGMDENSKKAFSLRVNGVFSLSSKSILEWDQEISPTLAEKDLYTAVEKTIHLVNECKNTLIDDVSFFNFLVAHENPKSLIDKNLYLMVLLYQGNISQAKEFLKEAMMTHTGGFCIGSKTFYELALEYCEASC